MRPGFSLGFAYLYTPTILGVLAASLNASLLNSPILITGVIQVSGLTGLRSGEFLRFAQSDRIFPLTFSRRGR